MWIRFHRNFNLVASKLLVLRVLAAVSPAHANWGWNMWPGKRDERFDGNEDYALAFMGDFACGVRLKYSAFVEDKTVSDTFFKTDTPAYI